MRFYDCKTAPSPRRARIFIAEKGIQVETIEVDLRAGEHLKEEFVALNAYGTVPVLQLEDGTCFTSTTAIWHYLDARYPDPPLMGISPSDRGHIADLQWHIETGGFMAMAEYLRNSAPGFKGRALTGPGNYEQIPALAERGKLRIERFLTEVDDLIGDKPFVAGDAFTVADIDLLVLIDFATWRKLSLPQNATRARRWHDAVSARPSAAL